MSNHLVSTMTTSFRMRLHSLFLLPNNKQVKYSRNLFYSFSSETISSIDTTEFKDRKTALLANQQAEIFDLKVKYDSELSYMLEKHKIALNELELTKSSSSSSQSIQTDSDIISEIAKICGDEFGVKGAVDLANYLTILSSERYTSIVTAKIIEVLHRYANEPSLLLQILESMEIRSENVAMLLNQSNFGHLLVGLLNKYSHNTSILNYVLHTIVNHKTAVLSLYGEICTSNYNGGVYNDLLRIFTLSEREDLHTKFLAGEVVFALVAHSKIARDRMIRLGFVEIMKKEKMFGDRTIAES